jgi:hypothetical protein
LLLRILVCIFVVVVVIIVTILLSVAIAVELVNQVVDLQEHLAVSKAGGMRRRVCIVVVVAVDGVRDFVDFLSDVRDFD